MNDFTQLDPDYRKTKSITATAKKHVQIHNKELFLLQKKRPYNLLGEKTPDTHFIVKSMLLG